jgi:hypothetical protein
MRWTIAVAVGTGTDAAACGDAWTLVAAGGPETMAFAPVGGRESGSAASGAWVGPGPGIGGWARGGALRWTSTDPAHPSDPATGDATAPGQALDPPWPWVVAATGASDEGIDPDTPLGPDAPVARVAGLRWAVAAGIGGRLPTSGLLTPGPTAGALTGALNAATD